MYLILIDILYRLQLLYYAFIIRNKDIIKICLNPINFDFNFQNITIQNNL